MRYLFFRSGLSLLSCTLISAGLLFCTMGHADEVVVLYDGSQFASWDTGRTPQRLEKEFATATLDPLPQNGGFSWRFVSRGVAFNDLFYREPLHCPFSTMRFRVRNLGADVVLATKVGDAGGAEWTANRVSVPGGEEWRWVEFPWSEWHVASWSKDTDGRLTFPFRYIALIAFDVKAGEQNYIEVSRLECIRPTPPSAQVTQLDVPERVNAGDSFFTDLAFSLDRPCLMEGVSLEFQQEGIVRFRVPISLDVRLADAVPGHMIATTAPVEIRIPQYAYGGGYSVVLRIGEAHVYRNGKLVDKEIAAMNVKARQPGKTAAAVRMVNGTPTLFINNKPHSGMAYTAYHPDVAVFADFAKAGVDLYSFSATPTEAGYGLSKTTWTAPGEYDYSQLDERVLMVLEANPDAYIFPRLYLHAPKWWSELHPDECVQYDPGDGHPVPFIHHNGLPAPCWVSEPWRKATIEGLRRLIAHVEAAPYADRVIGYHLASGTTEEWMMWGANEREWVGYSPANVRAFRQWLRRKYGTDDALQAAWKNPQVTLDTASVPLRAARETAAPGMFRDPQTEQVCIDFYLYNSWMVGDTICTLAKAVKEMTGRTKAVGVFYGYLLQLCGEQRQQNAGHLALGQVLASEDVDFLCSPTSYAFRQLGGEGTSHFMSLLGSVSTHGKLWFDENDIRTSLAPGKIGGWGKPEDVAGDILQQDKELANVIVNGVAQWWFDVGRNRYDDEQLMARIAQLNVNAQQAVGQDRAPVDQVALVVDEKSLCYLKVGDRLGTELLVRQLPALHRIGTPVGHYLASDLDRLSTHRMLILATSFAPDQAQREAVDRLKSDGRILLFQQGAGLYRDGAIEEAAMAAFTGITIRLTREQKKLAATFGGEDSLVHGLDGTNFGPNRPVDLLCVPDDPNATVLGTFEDGTPAVMVKRFDNWTAIYSAVPLQEASFLRRLAESAGIHLYIDTPDVVWACRDMVAVCVHQAGERTIHLPAKSTVFDVYAGNAKIARNVDRFDVTFAERATRLFSLTRQ